ncbi:unnamed protein product [Amoebophrya sp. A25]|nr:unnamed protein product [Amoebophrya sp. A25]|eukprot:GSA25T00023941001.1
MARHDDPSHGQAWAGGAVTKGGLASNEGAGKFLGNLVASRFLQRVKHTLTLGTAIRLA